MGRGIPRVAQGGGWVDFDPFFDKNWPKPKNYLKLLGFLK